MNEIQASAIFLQKEPETALPHKLFKHNEMEQSPTGTQHYYNIRIHLTDANIRVQGGLGKLAANL